MPNSKPIIFTVVGKPITQGSKKSVPIYCGPTGAKTPVVKDGRMMTRVINDNPKLSGWRQEVAQAAKAVYSGPLLIGAVQLRLDFTFPRPKSHYRTGRYAGQLRATAPDCMTTKPDSLKLGRAIEDALTGVVWRDDSQIVRHVINKGYGERAEVAVVIFPLDDRVEEAF